MSLAEKSAMPFRHAVLTQRLAMNCRSIPFVLMPIEGWKKIRQLDHKSIAMNLGDYRCSSNRCRFSVTVNYRLLLKLQIFDRLVAIDQHQHLKLGKISERC